MKSIFYKFIQSRTTYHCLDIIDARLSITACQIAIPYAQSRLEVIAFNALKVNTVVVFAVLGIDTGFICNINIEFDILQNFLYDFKIS